jgi:hypothetical protein
MSVNQFSAVTVRHKKILFCLVAAVALLTSIFNRQFASAQFSISSGQSCSSRGQIRDFQSQRFICLKVNAKAGSSSGPSLVWVKISSPKSTTKSTTTTVSVTSKTIKKSCQEGGICKIGDRGPGGGFVFYVNPDKSSTGWEYLEFAPSCVNYSHYPADKITQDAIAKYPNFFNLGCPSFLNYQVSAAADAYRTETKDDWFLPSREQLLIAFQSLYEQITPPLIMAECLSQPNSKNCHTYRSSTSDKPDWYWYVAVSQFGVEKGKKTIYYECGTCASSLRTIRSFNAVSP